MQVIEAALAFAITMLVLSLLCSALVETIHRVLGMREAGFRKMLGEFYDQVLVYADPENRTAREEFQRRMSSIRSPLGPLTAAWQPTPQTRWQKLYEWIATIWRGRGLSEQSVMNFMERLGADPIGRKLVQGVTTVVTEQLGAGAANLQAAINQAVDRTLQDVAQKFESFGKEATVYFERRARLLSVIVAMVVAFALHVDAVDLFSTLMRSPDARAALIATQDGVLKAYKQAEERAGKPAEGAPPASQAELRKLYEEALAEMRKTESRLRDLGVPIGWSDKRVNDAGLVWRWIRTTCEAEGQAPTPVAAAGQCQVGKQVDTVLFGIPTDVRLLIGLLLGGLLIGLGGPFWSEAISSITRARDVTRGVTDLVAPIITHAPPPGPAGERPTLQPRTPVDAFKVANQ